MITVLNVGNPTPKGSKPLTVIVEGHGLLRGYASASRKVSVGEVLGGECIAYDHEKSSWWVWAA